jgi:hypothetical protein
MVDSADPFVRMKSVSYGKPVPESSNPSRAYGTLFHPVCGACKTGTLHPLFTVRPKKTTVNSRMAATSPRGAFSFRFFFITHHMLSDHATPITDSPRAAVVPVDSGTGAKMPGSFGHDDDELDELIQKINRLGVD